MADPDTVRDILKGDWVFPATPEAVNEKLGAMYAWLDQGAPTPQPRAKNGGTYVLRLGPYLRIGRKR